MNYWLISVVGVVFLGILFDLIYPQGKTNALCKSIFGIIAVFVMISPILNIDINSINFASNIDSQLIDNINEAKINELKIKIKSHLLDCGIDGAIVRIDCNLSEERFEIQKIYIDTTNLVLTENITNINKYEVIINEVSKLLDIEEEKVIVYG